MSALGNALDISLSNAVPEPSPELIMVSSCVKLPEFITHMAPNTTKLKSHTKS